MTRSEAAQEVRAMRDKIAVMLYGMTRKQAAERMKSAEYDHAEVKAEMMLDEIAKRLEASAMIGQPDELSQEQLVYLRNASAPALEHARQMAALQSELGTARVVEAMIGADATKLQEDQVFKET